MQREPEITLVLEGPELPQLQFDGALTYLSKLGADPANIKPRDMQQIHQIVEYGDTLEISLRTLTPDEADAIIQDEINQSTLQIQELVQSLGGRQFVDHIQREDWGLDEDTKNIPHSYCPSKDTCSS